MSQSLPEAVIGRTIQLYLVDGVPNGLIIASIHGWTGSVLVASQTTFGRLVARPEVDRTGVYILFGPDPVSPSHMRAYIGEADIVRERIGRSAGDRDFWETAIVITTSDDALTKGHVRYLEARLIETALQARRATLDNTQLPGAERRRLPEADRANMEAFLANLRVILPVVGLDLLKPQPPGVRVPASTPATTATAHAGAVEEPQAAPQFEIRHKSGIFARAEEQDGEFVVLAGSQARKDTGSAFTTYADLKSELIAKGILAVTPDGGSYQFTTAYAFRSPSAAGAVVLDRSSNGRTEWKVVGTGQTYHAWQEAKAQASLAAVPQPEPV
jgi:hypothetical protein